MLARAAGMATCCELNYSETTYGSNLAIHLVFRAEACKVNRDHHPFLKRKGLYLQSYLKDQHAHQMCCGWTSVEAGIFRHGEEGQQSVCINPTAPEVKHCLSRSAPHSRGLLELSSLSQKSLTSASSHPLPTHPLHHTLSSAHNLWLYNRESRREEAEKRQLLSQEGAGKTSVGPSIQHSSSK